MNIGGGEAAEQVVRIMLSGVEVVLRLSASALRNAVAFLLAMAKNHKKVYGKTRIVRLLQDSRDLQCLQMTQAQFKEFKKGGKPLGILYSAVQDKRHSGGLVDVILPGSEIGRANILLERIHYTPDRQSDILREKEPRQRQEARGETRERSAGETIRRGKAQGFSGWQSGKNRSGQDKDNIQNKRQNEII